MFKEVNKKAKIVVVRRTCLGQHVNTSVQSLLVKVSDCHRKDVKVTDGTCNEQ